MTGETDPGAPGVPAPATIVGEYRVAGAGGREVDLGWAITVSINEDKIRLASQCVTPEWRYRYAGGSISTEIVPIPICERGRAPVEEAAIAAVDGATDVRRTPGNAIVIDGPGGSITLFSQ